MDINVSLEEPERSLADLINGLTLVLGLMRGQERDMAAFDQTPKGELLLALRDYHHATEEITE